MLATVGADSQSVIAHDFNNLLIILAGWVELGLRDTTQPEVRAYLQGAEGVVARGKQLVEHMNTPEVEDGEPVTDAGVSVNELVLEAAATMQVVAQEGIEVIVDVDDAGPCSQVHAGSLSRVILNLAMNACQAMDDQGTLRLSTELAGDWVCVRVADTGVGMTPDLAAKVFDPFYSTKGDAGTGLGLVSVSGIVEAAGGRVEVSSEPGHGSVFAVWLPAAGAAKLG